MMSQCQPCGRQARQKAPRGKPEGGPERSKGAQEAPRRSNWSHKGSQNGAPKRVFLAMWSKARFWKTSLTKSTNSEPRGLRKPTPKASKKQERAKGQKKVARNATKGTREACQGNPGVPGPTKMQAQTPKAPAPGSWLYRDIYIYIYISFYV